MADQMPQTPTEIVVSKECSRRAPRLRGRHRGLVKSIAGVAVAVMLANCASPKTASRATPSPSPSLDRVAVDRVIDRIADVNKRSARAMGAFAGSELPQRIGDMDLAQSDLNTLASQLRDSGLAGVPGSITSSVATGLEGWAGSFGAVATCMKLMKGGYIVFVSSDCGDGVKTAEERAGQVGRDVSSLISYGSRTSDEVIGMLNPSPS